MCVAAAAPPGAAVVLELAMFFLVVRLRYGGSRGPITCWAEVSHCLVTGLCLQLSLSRGEGSQHIADMPYSKPLGLRLGYSQGLGL